MCALASPALVHEFGYDGIPFGHEALQCEVRDRESRAALPAAAAAAEQITSYPPGIPAVVPGERLGSAVLDYLRSGLKAGMNLPDAADATLQTIKVVALSQ
jgi:arginine/lysine/ornithine decarboxylase